MNNFNSNLGQTLKTLAEISKKNISKNNKQTLILVEQIHHSYAPQSFKKEEYLKFTEQINDFQKSIFKILKKLDELGLDLLGIEDISYKDNEEIDSSEAAEMIKNSTEGQINSWYYEFNFPEHYKTYCPDVINIGGIRKAAVFASIKLLGREHQLEKEQEYIDSYFRDHLLNITEDEKNAIWEKLTKVKVKNPEISDTALFFNLVIASQMQGLIEALAEYYAASEITNYLEKSFHLDNSKTTDQTESLYKNVHKKFNLYVQKTFDNVEQNPNFDDFSSTFLKLIKEVYTKTIKSAPKLHKIFNQERSKIVVKNCKNILDTNQEEIMVVVFGAAHSSSIESACKENKLNFIAIKPKHPLWQKLVI